MARKKTDAQKATPADDDKILEEARSRYKSWLDADSEDRKRALNDLRFAWNVNNAQWDEEAKKMRTNRPCLTENRLPSFVRQAINEIRRSRPAVRVLPVDDQADPYTAQISEGLIRNIEQSSRADLAYDNASMYAGFCGRGYWKITTEYVDGSFDQDIVIKPVKSPFSIVDDPNCALPDKSDRKGLFETEWVDNAEFEGKFGEEPTPFEEAAGALGEHAPMWFEDSKTLIANYWRVRTERENLYLMTDGEVTKNPEEYVAQWLQKNVLMASLMAQMPPPQPGPPIGAPASPAGMQASAPLQSAPPSMAQPPALTPPSVEKTREADKRIVEWFTITGCKVYHRGSWAGQFIPFPFVGGEQVTIGNKDYTKGMISDAIDLSKANNYLLSTQIENVALTPKVPFIGPKGAFKTDSAKWANANQQTYAYIEYDGTIAPSRPDQVGAQPELMQMKTGVVDGMRSVIGLMGASLGDKGPETAWRAITARQQEGDTAIFHFMDNLVRAVRYGGIVMIDLMGKVYDTTRVLRIISPENQPLNVEIHKMFVEPGTGKQRTIDFSQGKYDVSVSAGPAFETQRQQTAQTLVDMSTRNPKLLEIAGDLIIKSIAPADGDKIAERIRRSMPKALLGEGPSQEEVQLQQQLQQAQQALAQASANTNLLQSELAKQSAILAGKQVDYQAKVNSLQSDLAKANIDREKAMLDVRKKELDVLQALQESQAGNMDGEQKLANDRLIFHVQQLLAAHEKHVEGMVGSAKPEPPEPMEGMEAPAMPAQQMPHEALMGMVAQSQQELKEAIAMLARATLAPRESRVRMRDGTEVSSISTPVMGG